MANESENSSILAMTAIDTVSLIKVEKEEKALLKNINMWFTGSETASMPLQKSRSTHIESLLKISDLETSVTDTHYETNRAKLSGLIAWTVGPHDSESKTLYKNPNPHWSNQGASWCYEFSKKISSVLADELDKLAINILEEQANISRAMSVNFDEAMSKLVGVFHDLYENQIGLMKNDQTRLNSLWWSEALYSLSLRCGYREIPPELAATVMAFDLLAEVSKPTPASVAHLLAETVNRLPGAGFDRKQGFRDWLLEICKSKDQFPQAVLKDLIPPPDEGRLSLRDAVVLALGKNPDVDAALRRTGISDDAELSLPVFSRALFRQEQAVRLAGGRA